MLHIERVTMREHRKHLTRRERLERAAAHTESLRDKIAAAVRSDRHDDVLEAVEECYWLQIALYGAQHATE
jgi:hypothetical protein